MAASADKGQLTEMTQSSPHYGMGAGFRIHLLFPTKQSKKDIQSDVLLFLIFI